MRLALIILISCLGCSLAPAAMATDVILVNPSTSVTDLISTVPQGKTYTVDGMILGSPTVTIEIKKGATLIGDFAATVSGAFFHYRWDLSTATPGAYTVQAFAADSTASLIANVTVVDTTGGEKIAGALNLVAGSTLVSPLIGQKTRSATSVDDVTLGALIVGNAFGGTPFDSVTMKLDGGGGVTYDFTDPANRNFINETDGATSKGIPHLQTLLNIGKPASDGLHNVTATLVAGALAPRTFTRSFISDMTGPTLNDKTSSFPSAGVLRISGHATDANGIGKVTVAYTGAATGTVDALVTPGAKFATKAGWSVDISGLAAGAYDFTPTVTDNAGNSTVDGTPLHVVIKATPAFTLTVAGLAPGALTGKVFTSTAAVIQADVTAGGPTNLTWAVTVNGVAVTNTSGTPATQFKGAPTAAPPGTDGNAHVVVTLTDDQMNTTTLTADTAIDDTAPVSVITSPATGDIVDGAAKVKVKGTVTDSNTIQWRILLDGNPVAAFAAGPFPAAGVDVQLSDSGSDSTSHTLAIESKDAAGNAATSATVTITGDSKDPNPDITSTFSNAVRGATTINFTLGEANVKEWQLLDGATVVAGGQTTAASATWNPPVDEQFVNHTFKLTVTDKVGRTKTVTKTNLLKVDTMPPTVTISASTPKEGAIVHGAITIAGAVTNGDQAGGAASIKLFVDGVDSGLGAQSGTSFSFSLTPGDGSHVFTVKATDTAGNASVSDERSSRSAIADNTSPTVQIVPPKGTTVTNDGSSYLKPVAVLPGETLAASVRDEFGIGSATSPLSAIAHYQFDAIDGAGNVIAGTTKTADAAVGLGGASSTTLPGAFASGVVRMMVTGYDKATLSDGTTANPNSNNPSAPKQDVIFLTVGSVSVSITSLDFLDAPLGTVPSIGGKFYLRGHMKATGVVNRTTLKSWSLDLYDSAGAVVVTPNLGTGTTNLPTPSELTVDSMGNHQAWNTDPLGDHSSDGSYKLRLTAVDADNTKTPSELNVVIDNTPPVNAITQPAAGKVYRDDVTVKATVKDPNISSATLVDSSGVTLTPDSSSYNAGTQTTTFTYTWHTKTGGFSDGSHTLTLNSTDLAGNPGNSATLTLTVDNTDPVVTLTDPQDGLIYNPEITDVFVKGSIVEDNLKRWFVKFGLDPGQTDPGQLADQTGLSINFKLPKTKADGTTKLPDGTYAITVTAEDTALAGDNSGTPNPHSTTSSPVIKVIVDETKPVVSFTSTYNTTPVKGQQQIKFNIDTAEPHLDSWSLKLDGAEVMTNTTTGDFTYNWSTPSGEDNVKHTFTLDAKDKAKNPADQKKLDVFVDSVPPKVTIDGIVNAPVVAGTISVKFTPTDGDTGGDGNNTPLHWSLLINGIEKQSGNTSTGTQITATYTPDALGAEDGVKTVTVKVTDRANNSGVSDPASVIADNIKPTVAIQHPVAWTNTNNGSSISSATPVLTGESLIAQLADANLSSTSDFVFTQVTQVTGGSHFGNVVTVHPVVSNGLAQTPVPTGQFDDGAVVKLVVTGYDVAIAQHSNSDQLFVKVGSSAIKIDGLTRQADADVPGGSVIAKGPNGDTYYLRGKISVTGTVNRTNLHNWRLDLLDGGGNVVTAIGSGTTNLPVAAALTPPAPTFWDTTAGPQGAFTLRFAAWDVDDTTTPPADQSVVKVVIDNAKPTATFSAPATLTGDTMPFVRGNGVTVTANIKEPFIKSYKLTDDAGTTIASGNFDPAGQDGSGGGFTVSGTWDTTVTGAHAVADGRHTLTLLCTDLAENPMDAVTLQVTVDNTNPAPTIELSPAPTVGPDGKNYETGKFHVLAKHHDVNPRTVEIYQDGGTTPVMTGSDDLDYVVDFAGLSEADHTFTVKVKDKSGNPVAGPATASVNVRPDWYAPEPQFTGATDNTVIRGQFTLNGRIWNTTTNQNEPSPYTWEIIRDGGVSVANGTGAFSSYKWDTVAQSIVDGKHVLTLTAKDEAGRQGQSAPLTLYVYNGAPTVQIDTPTTTPLVLQDFLSTKFHFDTPVPAEFDNVAWAAALSPIGTQLDSGTLKSGTSYVGDHTTGVNRYPLKSKNITGANLTFKVAAAPKIGLPNTASLQGLYIGTLSALLTMPGTTAYKEDETVWSTTTDRNLRAFVRGSSISVQSEVKWASNYVFFDQKAGVADQVSNNKNNPALIPYDRRSWTKAGEGQHVMSLQATNDEGTIAPTQDSSTPPQTLTTLSVTADNTAVGVSIPAPLDNQLVRPGSVMTLMIKLGASDAPIARLRDDGALVNAPNLSITITGVTSPVLAKALKNAEPTQTDPNGSAVVLGDKFSGFTVVWKIPITGEYKVGQSYTITVSGVHDIVGNVQTGTNTKTFRVGVN